MGLLVGGRCRRFCLGEKLCILGWYVVVREDGVEAADERFDDITACCRGKRFCSFCF